MKTTTGFTTQRTELKTSTYHQQRKYFYSKYSKYLRIDKIKAIALLEQLFYDDIETQNYIIDRGYRELGEEDLERQLNHQMVVTSMLLRTCPPADGVFNLSMRTRAEYE